MAQDGRQSEATEKLLAGLPGNDGRGLCHDLTACRPEGCQLRQAQQKSPLPLGEG